MVTISTHQLWSVAIRHNLSPDLLYFLDCCKKNIKPTGIIDVEAQNIKAIEKDLINGEGKLSQKSIQILDEFEMYLVKKKIKISKEVLGEDFMEKVYEYRTAFPKIRLPSGELARQSSSELKDRFIWFFKTYPEYDWDLILDATDYYNMVFEKKRYMYMATSSYFIKKTNPQTKETTSKLADYCEMILENPKILEEISK